jgi:hypothetical protein
MFKINNTLFYTILYIILFILLLYFTKPQFIFKPNGKPREYGIGVDDEGYKKTLYNLQFIIIIACIFIYKIIPRIIR